MPTTVTEQLHLLQAIGWGILHSFWQVPLLWLTYLLATTGKEKVSAVVKYNLSLLCLLVSFCWFLFTVFQQYSLLQNPDNSTNIFFTFNLPDISAKISKLLPYLSLVYLALLIYFILHFIQQYLSLLPLRNKGLIKAPIDTRLFTSHTAKHAGIKKNVQIWLTHKIDVPSVTGFFKPIILLPVALLNQLSIRQAEAIIIHELAHIKRNDYLVNFFQMIAELVLFFNPFARMLGSIVRQERENCCDDWVLNFQYDKHDYASALVMIEQQRTQKLLMAVAATNGRKNLLKRVQRIFTADPINHIKLQQQLKIMIAGLTLLAAMIVLLPAFQQTLKPTFATAATNHISIPKRLMVSSIETPELFTNKKPVQTLSKNNIRIKNKKTAIVKNKVSVEEENLTIALLNNELLKNNHQVELLAKQIANKSVLTSPTVFVKVEEEISGSIKKNIFYLELKNDNGIPTITPLAIISKPLSGEKIKIAKAVKITRKKRVSA
jgi:beta-lactamase regulating signal transducer with metallopeptidase domain